MGGGQDTCDDRRSERCHQDPTKRQRGNDQNIQNARTRSSGDQGCEDHKSHALDDIKYGAWPLKSEYDERHGAHVSISEYHHENRFNMADAEDEIEEPGDCRGIGEGN